MPSFQKTFGYGGDVVNAPLKRVNVELKVPHFGYSSIDTEDGTTVDRVVVDSETLTMTLAVDATAYHVAFADTFAVGRDEETFAQFQQYFAQARRDGDLAPLTVGVAVRYTSDEGAELGTEQFEFVHYPKLDLGPPPSNLKSVGRSASDTSRDSVTRVFVAVSKAGLLKLQEKLAEASVPMSDTMLMDIVSYLTDVRRDSPALQKKIGAELKRRLFEAAETGAGAAANKAFDLITKSFDSLYDFPLSVPALKPLTIAGTFKIVSPDDTDVSTDDFHFYTLAAEVSVVGRAKPTILHAAFADPLQVNDNTTDFSFPKSSTIVLSSVESPVSMRVKAFGSVLWSKDYAADDPALATLTIEVPLQRGNALVPADPSVPAKTKKLRGRVLALTKECPLKDLTVVIQARSDGDKIWRIVGAATTDAEGNFSLPYPYGVFVESQALVSAMPDSPAPIPVVADKGDKQTISDDFLFLLLKDMECPHDGTDEECDCHGPKDPSRLPDQTDLIGSDQYSQDIGGTCVNLSTPNRTLNEFTYQAIVRTSDPDVANYTLKKVDVPQPGIGTVRLSDISRGVTALDTAVRNGIFGRFYLSQKLLDTQARIDAMRGLTADATNASVTTALTTIESVLIMFNVILPESEVEARLAFKEVMDIARELKESLRAALVPRTETRYELVGGATKRKREPIDLDNPVAWQDAPDAQQNLSLYQAVTVATGHLLHYKSVLKADGYSLGELLYSLPLAPGQKKEIVVFDSAHTLLGAESQSLTQAERLAAGLVDERDIVNQLGGSIAESVRGSSSANTSGISAGFGTGGSGSGSSGAFGGSGSAVLGVAGGVANANSNAAQDSSRQVSQFFGEKLRQSIMQNAVGYRQLNASVVTTVQEGQRYGVTSEVVANHNHCHALTMMYFEVLRHYAVFQELSAVEECIFVPLLMTNFTTQNIYKWRDVFAMALLPMPSETYLQPFNMIGAGRQHPLLKAFDANERIKTNYANVDFPQGAYDDEQIQFVKGQMRLRVELPRPQTRFDRIMSLPIGTQTITTKEIDPEATAAAALDFPRKMAEYAAKVGATGGLFALFDKPPNPPGLQYTTTQHDVLVREAIFDAFMTLDANYQTVPPAQCIRITNFEPPATISAGPFGNIISRTDVLGFFAENQADRDQWTTYAELLGYTNVLKMLNAYFKGNLISEWDTIFNNEIAPRIFEKILASMNVSDIASDFSAESKYKGGQQVVRLNMTGTTSKRRNQLPPQLRMTLNDARLKSLQEYITLNVENITFSYSTSHYNGLLYSGTSSDDLLDGTTLFIPENSEEKRNPRKEDSYLVCKLIEHLNSNLEYYNKALWYSLDPDRRYMLLDGFDVEVFNDFGEPIESRSLASVVKNELISVAGNSLVFPVAAGYKVSQSYIMEKPADDEDPVKVTLLDHYHPLKPMDPYRISVPSKGVFAEAVQGVCNACEKIELERLQDWTRFPNMDEPTSIAPITTPVPAITDWQAAFKDFATPMVNIQNAPAAPAPAAGLAGLSDLLGKAGVFKDITGLDANQQNALRTYLSNQENAKAFGEMAKEMAMQSHNTQNSGKIMDSLNTAKTTGALNQQDYSDLVKDHLQQQIDGGVTKRELAERERLSTSSPVTKIGTDGANKGKNVRLERSEGSGKFESVEVSGGDADRILADFPGDVPGLKRTPPKQKDCWAVVTAMLMSWKNARSTSVEDAVGIAGEKYLERYRNDLGMKVTDKGEYIGLLDMTSEPPANHRAQRYIDWVNMFGPLWITTDAELDPDQFSLHARVLTKITGSDASDETTVKFTFIDPFDGSAQSESFADFITGFEQAVRGVRTGTLPIQVVHFKDIIERAEGGAKSAIVKAVGGKALEKGLELVQTQVTQSVTGGKGSLSLPVNVTPTMTGTSVEDYQPSASYDLAGRYCDIRFNDLVNDGPGAGLSGAIRIEWLEVRYRGAVAGGATQAERQGIRNTLFAKYISGFGSLRAGAAIEDAQVEVTIVAKGVDQHVQPPTSVIFANVKIHIEPKTALGVAIDGTVSLALHPSDPVDYDIDYRPAGPAYYVSTAKPHVP